MNINQNFIEGLVTPKTRNRFLFDRSTNCPIGGVCQFYQSGYQSTSGCLPFLTSHHTRPTKTADRPKPLHILICFFVCLSLPRTLRMQLRHMCLFFFGFYERNHDGNDPPKLSPCMCHLCRRGLRNGLLLIQVYILTCEYSVNRLITMLVGTYRIYLQIANNRHFIKGIHLRPYSVSIIVA